MSKTIYFLVLVFVFIVQILCNSNGIKIVTFLNSAYSDLLFNFHCNLRLLGLEKDFHVYLSEEDSIPLLVSMNISYSLINLSEKVSKQVSTYGETEYWKIARQKIIAFNQATIMFKEFIYSDVDVIWLRNPYSDLLKCAKHICFQSDKSKANKFNKVCNINSGFFYAKQSNFTSNFFKSAFDLISRKKFSKKGSQAILDYLLTSKFQYRKHIAVLNQDIYPNGAKKIFWSVELSTLMNYYPNMLILHNNYIRGKREKIERNRKTNTWFIGSSNECEIKKFSSLFSKNIL